jgi:hypothetical protein
MAVPQMNLSKHYYLWLWLGVLSITGLLTGCNRPSHQETRELGYKGDARTKPFLALTRVIDLFGWETKMVQSMAEIPDHGTLVLSGSRAIKPMVALQALEWVDQRNGHLILLMQGGDKWTDDWQIDWRGILEDTDAVRQNPILKALNLEPAMHPVEKVLHSKGTSVPPLEIEFGGKKMGLSDHGGMTFDTAKMPGDAEVIHGKDMAARIVTASRGNGRITVIGNGSPFRNRYIQENDNALVFLNLLLLESQPEYGMSSTVTFLLGSSDGFFSLLWKQFWMALVPLVLLVVAWLWKNIPRFGPLQPQRTNGTLQFTEHLQMNGSFLWHHGQTADLIFPIRAAICQKLIARHGMHPSESDANIIEHLARVSQLPSERIANAWNASFVKDGSQLLTFVQDLQTIEQSL